MGAQHREGPDVKIRPRKQFGAAKAAPNVKCSLLADYALEGEMQRHLEEPRAPDGVLDHTKLPPWRFASVCKVQSWSSTGLVWVGRFSRRVARETAEKGIEPHVVVWRIETRVIQEVKRLHVKLEPKSLCQFELLEDGHVHARLKWTSKDIAACGAETGFIEIAYACDWIARRDTVLAGSKKRHAKSRGIEHRVGRIYARGALCARIRSRYRTDSTERYDRVGDSILPAAIELTCRPTGEIHNAIGLTALRHHQPAEAPAIDDVAGETFEVIGLWQLILETHCQYVSTIKV